MERNNKISPFNYMLAFGFGVVLVVGAKKLHDNIQCDFRVRPARTYSVPKLNGSRSAGHGRRY